MAAARASSRTAGASPTATTHASRGRSSPDGDGTLLTLVHELLREDQATRLRRGLAHVPRAARRPPRRRDARVPAALRRAAAALRGGRRPELSQRQRVTAWEPRSSSSRCRRLASSSATLSTWIGPARRAVRATRAVYAARASGEATRAERDPFRSRSQRIVEDSVDRADSFEVVGELRVRLTCQAPCGRASRSDVAEPQAGMIRAVGSPSHSTRYESPRAWTRPSTSLSLRDRSFAEIRCSMTPELHAVTTGARGPRHA